MVRDAGQIIAAHKPASQSEGTIPYIGNAYAARIRR